MPGPGGGGHILCTAVPARALKEPGAACGFPLAPGTVPDECFQVVTTAISAFI